MQIPFLYRENRVLDAWKKPSDVAIEVIWVLRIDMVYGIENEIANIILCLYQSIAEKCFITKKENNWENIEKIVWVEGCVNIPKGEVCLDHVYMPVEILPKRSVSSLMEYLKNKSSTMWRESFRELKYKYRNREFCSKGYCVNAAGKNVNTIAEYIINQPREQLTPKWENSFKGSRGTADRLGYIFTHKRRREDYAPIGKTIR